jgi:type I restriction enzyme S subunit
MNVILSVKPKFAIRILSGEKAYEFRKVVFDRLKVDRVYIYSTSPVQQIVGSFRVGKIHKDTPAGLWNKCNGGSGLTEEEFFRYFNGNQYGYAIEIDDLNVFEEPLDPIVLKSDFKPPQNYCYVR